MAMRLTFWVAVTVPLLAAACASQPVQTAEQTTKQGVNDAAHAPFEDFILVRSKIPKVLLAAASDPYSRPQPVTCEALSGELARLAAALGPDFDTPKVQ